MPAGSSDTENATLSSEMTPRGGHTLFARVACEENAFAIFCSPLFVPRLLAVRRYQAAAAKPASSAAGIVSPDTKDESNNIETQGSSNEAIGRGLPAFLNGMLR